MVGTALGHSGGFGAYDAALVNGTAAHGEDYDDTFEGGPVHSGAVVVPAVVAVCEREGLSGQDLLRGVVAGCEIMCRLSLVTPKAIHKAGFHPTAVLGALAAAAGVRRRCGAGAQAVDAIGSRAAWHRGSSSIWRRGPGPSGCTRAGRRRRGAGGVDGAGWVFGAAHGARGESRVFPARLRRAVRQSLGSCWMGWGGSG